MYLMYKSTVDLIALHKVFITSKFRSLVKGKSTNDALRAYENWKEFNICHLSL